MAETRLIQGRYRPLDLIGRGGMGEVWRARDESLGRHVAVKCLKPLGPGHDPQFTQVLRERFRREARVAASLQHRGVTVVHDFGDDSAAGGMLFLVMELLHGRNLSQLLDENDQRPLPVDEVLDIAEQVAAALAYTHEQGIVHRDLKPANIMRLTDGTVKICDFGIARLAHDIGFTAKLTGGGMAMGTPHYMSPEQIAGTEVDHRSDLYSLGCVLYEIATGAPPFDLGDSWSVLVGHRDTAPEPLRTHRGELPAFFEEAVLDLLAKCPEERPADAAALYRRLVTARSADRTRTPGPAGTGAVPGLPVPGAPVVPVVPVAPGVLPVVPGVPGGTGVPVVPGTAGAAGAARVGGAPRVPSSEPAVSEPMATGPMPAGSMPTGPVAPGSGSFASGSAVVGEVQAPLPGWARGITGGPRPAVARATDSGAWAQALTGVWTAVRNATPTPTPAPGSAPTSAPTTSTPGPGPLHPGSVHPGPSRPGPVRPEPVHPEFVGPESVDSAHVGPGSVDPASARPKAVRRAPVHPDGPAGSAIAVRATAAPAALVDPARPGHSA
ncbi:protein kinase domain-containing protein, partial [Streptomyces sp. 12297]